MGKDNDELEEINGVKPKVYMRDGDENEVAGSGKSKYKIKRTWDHYHCSCPAWRNQKGVLTEARSCKHLRAFLGDAYEDARIAWKTQGSSGAPASSSSKPASGKKSTSAKKPASERKPTSSKKTTKRGRDAEDDDEEHEEQPKKKARPASTRSSKRMMKVEEGPEPDADEQVEEEDADMGSPRAEAEAKLEDPPATAAADDDQDELAEIDGIRPNKVLKDGEEHEAQSQTSSATYKIKRTFDHYYCTCPAWRNQGGRPVNARTCKHLRAVLGDAYEDARLKLKDPDGDHSASGAKKKAAPKKKAAAKKKKKAADGDEDEEEEDEDEDGGKVKVELLLAGKWDLATGADPTDWWMSEKLDGVRTFWDGTRMLSRLGNPFTPPQWFKDKLPKDVTLDGELFGGRGEFQSTVSIVKTNNSPKWKDITFQIFDVPSIGTQPFEERIAFARKLFGKGGKYASMHRIKVLEQECVRDREHVLDKLKEIEGLGGEGVMLRKPQSLYEGKRSNTLLKVKTFYDAEAEVVGYEPGKGRHKGSTGALKCVMESGKKFNVGTGLSDAQRKKPPKIGAIVVYRFQELTRDGVPRFPSFIGEAADKDEPKDAEVPAHRKTAAKASD